MSVIESNIPNSVKVGDFVTIQSKVLLGENTRICNYVNLYGCSIGSDCMIGSFTEIQSNVIVGNNTRIQSHSFICSHTQIGDNVFVGHNVMTINETFSNGQVNYSSDMWKPLIIEDNVIVGSGAILFPVTIGEGAIIGAGAVVTKDVQPNTIVVGNPAKQIIK